ncbi:MAG: hypothetical protein RIQ56_426 [Candidatus Parcubacteria bacterium]|jgi:hypothetical protein
MWGMGALLAAVLALGFWFSMKNSSPSTGAASSNGAAEQKSSGTLAALMQRSGAWKCEVSHSSANDKTEGVVYVSGGKVRGDFTSNVPGMGLMESHMLVDSDYMYMWSSAMPNGMKMKADDPKATDSPETSGAASLYGQNYDYDCSPWSVDSSKFQLPKDVNFSDMSAMMQDMMSGVKPAVKSSDSATSPPSANCSMCDQAPAEARAQCRAALGCK